MLTLVKYYLDPRARWHYAALAVYGALLAGLAHQLGLHEDLLSRELVLSTGSATVDFLGYWSRPNWMSLPVLMPASLLALRAIVARISKLHDPDPPPLAMLFPAGDVRTKVSRLIRQTITGRSLWIWILAATAAIQCADMAELVSNYWTQGLNATDRTEFDWTVMFLAGQVPQSHNLTLVLAAYTGQLWCILCGVSLLLLLAAHNTLFLRLIWLRSRQESGDPMVAVDLNDEERRFGLLPASEAFNCQVTGLIIAACLLSGSRIANVAAPDAIQLFETGRKIVGALKNALSEPESVTIQAGALAHLLRDTGQWIIVLAWLILFAIVLLPARIKVLPGLRFKRRREFLRQFVPDGEWPVEEKEGIDANKVLDLLASKFRANSFWPSGDNKARVLFGFAIAAAFFMVLPLRPVEGYWLDFLLFVAVVLAATAFLSKVLFVGFQWLLYYVHPSLVSPDE